MRFLVRSFVGAVALLTACGADPVGRTFASQEELLHHFGGHAVVGALDVHYPARVLAEHQGHGEVRFVHGGTPRTYALPGQLLRAVEMEHRRGRGVLVLRADAVE